MNIYTERLKRDRAYWDEVAPEGATHYVVNSICPWEKRVINNWLYFDAEENRWKHLKSNGDDRLNKILDNLTILYRPEPATEWDGDGLPTAGTECEFYTVKWRIGKVLCYVDGRHGKQGIVQFDDDWQCFCPEDVPERVRPIRTKAEREREWLIDIIPHPGFSTKQDIADAILKQCTVMPKETDQ